MGRRDLPEEFSGPLDFAQLLTTQGVLDGERVGVELLKRDGPGLGSSVAIAGTLRRLGERDLTRGWFAVGDGARLALFESDYRTTHLLTYDGNDGFQLVIELQQGTVIIGDVMITAVDATMPEVE